MPLSRTLSVALVMSLAAAGCGGRKGAMTPTAGGPPYAGVFVDRPAAHYRYLSKTSMYDPDDPKADANGSVVEEIKGELTCATRTSTVEAWQVATIECSGDDGMPEAIAGTFVAGPAGIWRLADGESADAAGLAVVAARPPLLAAAPTAVDEKKADPSDEFGEFRKVTAVGAAWCVETGSWGGDEAGEGMCFAPAAGITKVTRYSAGGSVRDESLELIE